MLYGNYWILTLGGFRWRVLLVEPSEPSSTLVSRPIRESPTSAWIVGQRCYIKATRSILFTFTFTLPINVCPDIWTDIINRIDKKKKTLDVRVQFSCFQFCFLSLPLLLQFFYCCSIVLFLARFGIKDIDLHSTVIFLPFENTNSFETKKIIDNLFKKYWLLHLEQK